MKKKERGKDKGKRGGVTEREKKVRVKNKKSERRDRIRKRKRYDCGVV